MRILWLTWKDMEHPQAGGAEVVNEELAKRLVADGHEVHFVVGGFAGCAPEVSRGFKITRLGNRFSVYWHAYRYYTKHLRGWPDLVIDEMNTIPFFARFYVSEPSIMFVHQLAREIWFYQMPQPLSTIGYLLEPLYLWLLRSSRVITVSESTKRDLVRYGFADDAISIISEGIELTPVGQLDAIGKYDTPTILSLGSVRPMKRTLDIVRAFELLKARVPRARLIIAGDAGGAYGKRVTDAVARSPYAADIRMLGRVSPLQRSELLCRAHVLAVTSVKEGWGLVVTEANSQGTPAVVYDVDGLRDSVQDGKTGIVTKANTPEALAEDICSMLCSGERASQLRRAAWEWSKCINFEAAYSQFRLITR